MKKCNPVLLKDNKMRKYIDQLLIDGKYEEAIPFIEEIWEKEAQAKEKILRVLNKKLNSL